MHILIVLDHPNPKSFSRAVADEFIKGAQQSGHSTELADLHSENFNPIWTMADVDGDLRSERLADIRQEHTRIERADAICLVFPLYWWGMPSMMKGWIDRVWTYGWAYNQLGQTELSLQRNRSGLLLVPAGARSDEIEANGHLASMENSWLKATFGYFGFNPRKLELLCGSGGSDARRRALLNHSFQLGLSMPPPDPDIDA